jgi:GNAT superfamily N-acetyltransferase
VQVRQADLDDVDRLAQLRAVWRGHPTSAEFFAAFREWFLREQSSRWWWIALVDDDAIGMVNVKIFDRMPAPDRFTSQWGYLANLFVIAEHRGGGAGSALVTAVVERARVAGLVRLVLSPSELSVPLYGRHGFRPATDLLILPLLRDR